jgi:NADPH-dependent 2,4-dienoyl-CoA reductase/sulfur reductase-like enzyme
MYKPKNIIIVGGNAAGPAAAAQAKRTAPDANVIMFEASEFISTGTCEFPYVISGEIADYSKIVFFTAESFEAQKNVKVYLSHKVELIDRKRKIIKVLDSKNQKYLEFPYDSLILCTGSRAKSIPAITSTYENVFKLKSVNDLILIQKYFKNNDVKRVLIIGSGYIGLEVADALINKNISVDIAEIEDNPLPKAEPEIRLMVKELLHSKNINFYSSTSIQKYSEINNKIVSVKIDGYNIEYDAIFICTGFVPNSELASASKLELTNGGAIKVNRKMQTSDPAIYAAGDCVEVTNYITNKNQYLPIATNAYANGHIAGTNAGGGNSFSSPVVPNLAVSFLGRVYSFVGICSNSAQRNNFRFLTVSATAPNLVKVMKNSQIVFGKVIVDRNSKLILGANFFGGNEISGYSDLISSFIKFKIPAKELANVNFNYTPPISPFINILTILGKKINKELE